MVNGLDLLSPARQGTPLDELEHLVVNPLPGSTTGREAALEHPTGSGHLTECASHHVRADSQTHGDILWHEGAMGTDKA